MTTTTRPSLATRRIRALIASLCVLAVAGVGIVPSADADAILVPRASAWSYRVDAHGACAGFESPSYGGPCAFGVGSAPFGNSDLACGYGYAAATSWPANTDLLLYRTIVVPQGASTLHFDYTVDNNIQIYLDGGSPIWQGNHGDCNLHGSFDRAVPPGTYKLAVRAVDVGVLSYFDMSVTAVLSACADGVDNDGDGATDYPNDPGCADVSDDSERGTAACDDGADNDGDGRSDYPDDAGCSGPADASEEPNCGETAPGVVVCVSTGREVIAEPLLAIRAENGTVHDVAGYLDSYRFALPGGGGTLVPCVTLVHDGATDNPCAAAGGTFVSRVATLVPETTVTEPVRASSGTVRVCEAEVTATVIGFGVTSAQAYAIC